MLLGYCEGTDHKKIIVQFEVKWLYPSICATSVSASRKHQLLLLLQLITSTGIARSCGSQLERQGHLAGWPDPHVGSQEVSADSAFLHLL